MSLEIERRYLIHMPNPMALMSVCREVYVIEQVYLKAEKGITARVRHRVGATEEFFYTEKEYRSDMTRVEREKKITQEECEKLLAERRDPELQPVCKRRYCMPIGDLTFEIDIFPFWRNIAVMEVELESEDQKVELPQGIDVIAEVTGEVQLTNAALAHSVPPENFLLRMYGGKPEEKM